MFTFYSISRFAPIVFPNGSTCPANYFILQLSLQLLYKGTIMAQGRTIDKSKNAIVGVGSALVDILLLEDDAFLASTGANKGGMTLVDKGENIDTIVARSTK